MDDLERLYRTQRQRLLRFACGMTGDPESAKDALHDAFVACVRTIQSYRGDGSLEAWVWRAVVTSCLKTRRTERRHERDRVEIELLADASPQAPAVEHVRRAVRRLPDRERLILFMAYYADLDYRTIADALQISQGTVGAALHAARRTVKQVLEREEALSR